MFVATNSFVKLTFCTILAASRMSWDQVDKQASKHMCSADLRSHKCCSFVKHLQNSAYVDIIVIGSL